MAEPTPPTGSHPRRLVGVGLGPGDPGLVTVKGVATLAAAEVILVPQTEAAGNAAGRAERIVTVACPGASAAIRRVPFSMADPAGVTSRRRQAWADSAAAALDAFETGAHTVVFATVGDPSVYSTFSYLAGHVTQACPDVAVEVVPGISAMQALAATSRVPLVEGTEVLALVPVTAGLDVLERALDVADTVVAYKAGRCWPQVRELLDRRGRTSTSLVGTDVSLPSEHVRSVADLDDEAPAPYFSTVLVAPARTSIGGRL